MADINLATMAAIMRDLFWRMVLEAHGDPGVPALAELIDFIQELYKAVPPEQCRFRIVIVKPLDDLALPALTEVGSLYEVAALIADHAVVIQRLNSGLLRISTTDMDVVGLAANAVVYSFESGVECFYAKAQQQIVKNPVSGSASVFAVATFTDLKQALEDYKMRRARKCSCPILAKAWRGRNRLFFKAAPERTMQESLAEFLDSHLRGNVEVRREQNVNPTQPIDIKVTWFMTNRLALIEVKWLGKSLSAAGKITSRTDARAREGAKQLAAYLDDNASEAPIQETRGYLVVIDGRRAGLKRGARHIDRQKGLKYSDREIAYSPKYHETRADFETPIRLFVEPICG
jgi:hypothetical protein